MVRFSKGLPKSISRVDRDARPFSIPKAKRAKALQFMQRQPQHIVKRRKTSWEVVGIAPHQRSRDVELKGSGSSSSSSKYGDFLRNAKKALEHIPEHALSRLSRGELQKHPSVKGLYERHFKHSPDLINYESVLNVIASDLLDYDARTGAVRGSMADVRMQKKAPVSTLSLSITRDSDFDRIMLQILSDELTRRSIPMVFLKSSYFTARVQLQQLFDDNPSTFAGELESVRQRVESTIWRDYVALTNETNRIYLAKYPFERVALRDLGLTAQLSGFSGFRTKLATILQLSLTVPGSAGNKFRGLEEMSQTYASTVEAQLMNPDHFMHGLHRVLTTDKDFVIGVLKNNNHSIRKVYAILRGNSL